MTTAPGLLVLPSGPASAADARPVAVDPSTASFRALARQVRAMGLLDRRPGYYRVKITLTILAFFAGWALFVTAGNSWTTLAVAPLVGMMFTQLAFIGHDAGHNQVFGARRKTAYKIDSPITPATRPTTREINCSTNQAPKFCVAKPY